MMPPDDTPLSSYFTWVPPRPTGLSPHVITSLLLQACLVLGNSTGITTQDISVKSLRASGAMALLNEQVDPTKIQLLGRWKSSDSMISYLHIQANNVMSGFSVLML